MQYTTPMLLLTEGDAETWDSWSGSSHALLLALRAGGIPVTTVDVARYGIVDMFSKVATAHPRRERWAARHHYGPIGFHTRSAIARQAIVHHPVGAPVVQIGATFGASELGDDWPLYCYCDANVVFASRSIGYNLTKLLRPDELQAMTERERRVYESATGIFTMSECVRQSFIEDFGVPPHRVHAVYAGPNMRHVPTDSDLKCPKGPSPTILFVGKAFERKGGPILVDAFQRVREVIPDARLIIVGCRPALPSLPGIEIIGHVDRNGSGPGNLQSLYLAADVFCMPSQYEPYGIVFVEAMLHGVPCIGTTEWAMPEIISDGKTGWLVPPRNVDALARALIEALRNRDRLRAMGAAARQRALTEFTWERTAARMIEVVSRSSVWAGPSWSAHSGSHHAVR